MPIYPLMDSKNGYKAFSLFERSRSTKFPATSSHATTSSEETLRQDILTPEYTPDTSPLPFSHAKAGPQPGSCYSDLSDQEHVSDKWSEAARLAESLSMIAQQCELSPDLINRDFAQPKPVKAFGDCKLSIQSAPTSPAFNSSNGFYQHNKSDLLNELRRPHSAALPSTEKLLDLVTDANWHHAKVASSNDPWPDVQSRDSLSLPNTPVRSPDLHRKESSTTVPSLQSSPLTPLPVTSAFHSRSTSLADFLATGAYGSLASHYADFNSSGRSEPKSQPEAYRRGVGRVKFFHPVRGYGFILPDCSDDNEEIFVHYTVIHAPSKTFKSLVEDSTVEFVACRGPKGWYAVSVTGPKGSEVPQPYPGSVPLLQYENFGGHNGDRVPEEFVRKLRMAMRSMSQLVERLPGTYREQAFAGMNSAFYNPKIKGQMDAVNFTRQQYFCPINGATSHASSSTAPATTFPYMSCMNPVQANMVNNCRYSTPAMAPTVYAPKPPSMWDGMPTTPLTQSIAQTQSAPLDPNHPYYIMYSAMEQGAPAYYPTAQSKAVGPLPEMARAALPIDEHRADSQGYGHTGKVGLADSRAPGKQSLEPVGSISCPGSPYHFQSRDNSLEWLKDLKDFKSTTSDLYNIVEKAKLRRLRENICNSNR